MGLDFKRFLCALNIRLCTWQLISAADRHRQSTDHPIKFILRRQPHSLRFKIKPGANIVYIFRIKHLITPEEMEIFFFFLMNNGFFKDMFTQSRKGDLFFFPLGCDCCGEWHVCNFIVTKCVTWSPGGNCLIWKNKFLFLTKMSWYLQWCCLWVLN